MDSNFFEKSTIYNIYNNKLVNIKIKIIIKYTDNENNRKYIEKEFEFHNIVYNLIPNNIENIMINYPIIFQYLNNFNRYIINYDEYNIIKIQLIINKVNDNMSILSDKDFSIDDFFKKLNLLNINNAKI